MTRGREFRRFSLVQAQIGLLLLMTAAALSFSQSGEGRQSPENPLKGSRVFVEKGCIKCHISMEGDQTFGPDLTSIGHDKNFYGLAGALWSHSPKMLDIMREKDIERPELTPEETEDLMSYVYFQGFFDPLGYPRQGEQIYESKGCARCHTLGGGGNSGGPSLDKYGRYISPVFIATALWNHSSSVSEAMVGLSFAPHEMSHLLAFIKENALNEDGETVYLEPGNPREGQNVFRQKRCDACHGEGGRDLNTSQLQTSLTEIVEMMWNHSSPMWRDMRDRGLRVPSFTNKEMADLVAFLYFIPYFGDEEGQTSGQAVLTEKGCISCHSQKAVSENKGIDLAEVSHYSIFELISVMWNHVPEMEKMLTEFNMPWPRFEKEEMMNLISYIRSMK